MSAVKFDKDKPPHALVPKEAIDGIARSLGYGASKYAPFNYKLGDGLDWLRIASSLSRHLKAWESGEDFDPESLVHHLDMVGGNFAMLIDLVKSGIGHDGRFKGKPNEIVHTPSSGSNREGGPLSE